MKLTKKIFATVAAFIIFGLAIFSHPVKTLASYRIFIGDACVDTGGNCLPTICVGPGCPPNQ